MLGGRFQVIGQPGVSVLTFTLFESGFLARCSIHQAKEPQGLQSAGITAVSATVCSFTLLLNSGLRALTESTLPTEPVSSIHFLVGSVDSHIWKLMMFRRLLPHSCAYGCTNCLESNAKKRNERGKELCLEGPRGMGGDELGWI